MSLGGLYQRLLVAAGAVAFLVVNWFCKPVRRQPPQAPQEPRAIAETEPERQALLTAKEDDDRGEDTRRAGDAAPETASYEAPELSQLGESEQLHDDTVAAPEDVVMESVQGTISSPQNSSKGLTGEGAAGQSNRIGQSSSAAAASTVISAEPAARGEPIGDSPVDENYLKSLLDQEFGPPKFAVRKPAPAATEQQQPPAGDDRSLQQLLDQAFGPPRFAVPKPASPPPGGPADSSERAAEAAAAAPAPGTDAAAAAPAIPGAKAVPAAAAALAAVSAPVAVGGVKRSAEELERGAAADAAEATPEPAAAAPPGVMALALSVMQGPAAGRRVVAEDPATEYKIGRLPDSWLQVLDQEVSGRHAAVRWDSASSRWMLRDVGSLNGTALCGEPIGREYKVPGEERPLADGDCVLLGSVTQLRVELAAGAGGAAAVKGCGAVGARTSPETAAPAAAKRHHSASFDVGGSSEISAASSDRSHQETVMGLPGMAMGLPTPGTLVDCPELGARLCVHNRLGVDHKRLSQGCEDVPHWELPFAPYARGGIVCVFDGHHGSKAAHQAKEHLPAILRTKLLRRDGRQPPHLPPPPPPPPRRADGQGEGEEGEEDMMEGYEGSSSEEVLEEEVEGGEGEEAELGGGGVRVGGSAAAGQGHDGGESSPSGPGGGGGGDGPPDRNGGGAAEAAGGSSGIAVEEETEPEELLPPPPVGPPLPPLLRGRDLASQRALLKDTFLLADQYMSMEEGCTATLVMLDRDPQQGDWLLQSANVGDSSAVLVNFTRGSWCKLSEDHRIASSSSERERLARMGHTVRTRLYGLNISRMLGDRFLKEEDLGFLAEPFVGLTAQVGATDHAVLIVASDGLWDVLPEERAAVMLLQEAARSASLPTRPTGATRQPSSSSASSSIGGLAPPPAGAAASAGPPSAPSVGPGLGCQTVADMLLTKALVLRSKDDITISVLELGPHLRAA